MDFSKALGPIETELCWIVDLEKNRIHRDNILELWSY
jgi:hypothetical protein